MLHYITSITATENSRHSPRILRKTATGMSEFLHSAASPRGDTDCEGKHPTAHEMTCNLAQSWRYCSMLAIFLFPRYLLHRQYIQPVQGYITNSLL